jgi:hypothetical protein
MSRIIPYLVKSIVAGALACGVLASPAWAAGAQSASGTLTSGPFTLQFTASRAAGAAETAATGSFSGRLSLANSTLMELDGPVTCLDVVGDQVGLFYPVRSSIPTGFSKLVQGVFIYAQLGRDGKPQSLSFLPVPTSQTNSCPPLPAYLPVTAGTLTLNSPAPTQAAPAVRHKKAAKRHATGRTGKRHVHRRGRQTRNHRG